MRIDSVGHFNDNVKNCGKNGKVPKININKHLMNFERKRKK